ncbi:MAG TPA: M14 family zinc carboxypeptidase [Bacteroidia bacterium]|nr:M14 family zinc carboxypeptidase [Bacteroidia bacterium]
MSRFSSKLKCSLLTLLLYLVLYPYSSQGTGSDSDLYQHNPPYDEVIKRYRDLANGSPYAKLIPYGETDGGQTIHLFVITKTGVFNPGRLHELGKLVLLINNGIHPGEPDGINASLLVAENLLADNGRALPEHVAICIIPVLNIEGAMERGCCSRVNQNGPAEYGFRGNSQYLDLNRDFIKGDSQNTISFIKIFRQWDPEVFIDTHVSDGADYQYTMTLIASQHDKLYSTQGEYMDKTLRPELFKKMKEQNSEMGPYVETFKWDLPPDSGIIAFLETPRYTTGYTTLFNTFGFIAESHMLKPFAERVYATELLLNALIEICDQNFSEIIEIRSIARKENEFRKEFTFNWKLDTTQSEKIIFKGYEHGYKTSKVTGLERLFYDREKPFSRKIVYYNNYIPQDTISSPLYYLIPQAWKKAIQIMHINGIRMIRVDQDSSTSAEVYYIKDYATVSQPYEGHYLHYDTEVAKQREEVKVNKGDYLVPVFQEASRYVIETLEPKSVDSYFNWGFFDQILQQKEWFSAYAFEEIAENILSEDSTLSASYEKMKQTDEAFAKSSFSQLYYIYKNSKYFEKGFKRYPVCRIGYLSDALK